MSVNKSKLVKSIQERGKYSTVPNDLWDMPISVKAKTAYCYLLAQSEKWNPGLREIAAGISMSKNSARDAIRELEGAGMIQVEEGPHGARNLYMFTAISDWTAHPNSAPPAHPESDREPIQPLDGDPSKFCTGGGAPTGHIQEEPKKNTIQTQYEGKVRSVNIKEADKRVPRKSSYSPQNSSYQSPDPLRPEDVITSRLIQDDRNMLPSHPEDGGHSNDMEDFQNSLELIPISWKRHHLGTHSSIKKFMSLPLADQLAVYKSRNVEAALYQALNQPVEV